MNLKPLRRRLYEVTRKLGLQHLAALLYPGMRMRLWDKDWNLVVDSDRGDSIPAFETIDHHDIGHMLYEPATYVRYSGILSR